MVACSYVGPHLAEYQPLLAHSAIDSGADLVLGHHPHVPQGVEVYKDRAIFYSLGNFMFGWEKMKARHPEGLLIHCSVDNRKIVKASYAPVYRNDAGQPRLVTTSSPEGRDIVQTVESLSKPLGTPFDVTEHEVVVWRA